MLAAAALKQLLGELESARGLRGRLRILARSFDLLRSLDRADRERVALRVGSDWAWKQIERAFMRDGRLSEGERVIQQAFETIGSADPAELREAARRIRARDTEGLEQAAVRTLERILEEDDELGADPAETEREPLPGIDPAGGEAPHDLEAAIETVSHASEELGQGAEPAPPGPEGVTPPPPPAKRPPLPSPALPPIPTLTPIPPIPPLGPAALEPSPEATTGPPGPPSAGVERLRALRLLSSAGSARELGRDGRREFVAGLGGSWATRRAISAMIESGALDDLDEVLSLLDLLDRDSRKTWCLIDLIVRGGLDLAERARVLEAAPNLVARRRIERRLRLEEASRAQ